MITDLNSVSVFINGLRQASTTYIVNFEWITFSGELPTTGDQVTLAYQ